MVTAALTLHALLLLASAGIAAASVQPPTDPCASSSISSLPFCNTSLSVADRAADLVSRLSLQDKVAQLATTAAAVESLGLPAYQWWSEGLHGVADSPGVLFGNYNATSFPQVIATASSFDAELFHLIGEVVATEARALNNLGRAGLTYFTPNINIFRDPRWGRGQETPGEDPLLTSTYATEYVTGLQGDGRYLRVVATCKHFAAYDLENVPGTNITRYNFNAVVSQAELEDTLLPAFRACVRNASAASIMCSYNAVNGIPSCAHSKLNNALARQTWGFADGYIVSDCGAVGIIQTGHHYTNNSNATVAAALTGGTDLDCGSFMSKHAQAALQAGAITVSQLDTSLRRLFAARLRLGMLDPPSQNAYRSIPPSVLASASHAALARRAAEEAVVLLHNKAGVLPLKGGGAGMKLALIGPNADAAVTQLGNYYGKPAAISTPLTAMQAAGVDVTYEKGCDIAGDDTSGIAAAAGAAGKADVSIVVLGLNASQEAEMHDRVSLAMPGKQWQLFTAVRKAAKGAVILIIMSGGPVDATPGLSADALLWVGYPGQAGGEALWNVLSGAVSPSGRLPTTMYPAAYAQAVNITNMSMQAGPGRTYRYYKGKPVFAFGTGLSYTTFSYKWSSAVPHALTTAAVAAAGTTVSVNVTNTGTVASNTSVLAYVTPAGKGAPIKQLAAFQRTFLQPQQSRLLHFHLPSMAFSVVTASGGRAVHAGAVRICIGQQQLCAVVQVSGEQVDVPL